jgi:hypothetical protein
MKKFVVAMVLFSVLGLLSCGTVPGGGGNDGGSSPSSSSSSSSSPIEATTPEEKEFQQIYETYESSIILEGAKNYSVVKGDTLSSIAIKSYGSKNGFFFPLIMLASQDVILDPDLIEVGMALSIPDLERNLADAKARAAIKSFLKDIAAVYERKGDRRSLQSRDGLIGLSDSL